MPKVGMEPIRRAALVKATIAEIGEAGTLDVTVSQIAKRAGMSSALAHHYFGGKEQIFLAAMRHTLAVYAAETRGALMMAEGPRARLEAVVRAAFSAQSFRREVIAAWLNFYVLAQASPDAARLLKVYHARLGSNLGNVRVTPKRVPISTKPSTKGAWRNAPNVEKWNANGGQVFRRGKGYVYRNADGVEVPYTKDGYPQFPKKYIKTEVDIPEGFVKRSTDFSRAFELSGVKPADLGTKPPSHTWHHHENGKTMQLVDYHIHRQFTHRGGISHLKKPPGS